MLSVILLSYNSNEHLSIAVGKLKETFIKGQVAYEIIIIDDGSDDNSFTIALDLEKNNENVRAYQLSKNYTSSYAIFAGLSLAKGDCAIALPDDEQQPYNTITEMYSLWETGHKIIIPNRIRRDDGFFRALSSNVFYRIMNMISNIKYPVGGADSFLIDREIIDILNKINPVNTSIIAEILNLGYNAYFYPYIRGESIINKSRWTWKKKRKLLNDLLFSTSVFPVKIIKYTGLVLLILGTGAIIIYLISRINGFQNLFGVRYPSWAATAVLLSLFSGLVLFALGIIAEYIWRILCEVRNRPGFIVRKKDNNEQS